MTTSDTRAVGAMPEQETIEQIAERSVRYLRISEMTWPIVDADLVWRLRYSPKSVSSKDRLYLASVLSAYEEMIRCGRAKREMVCRAIREGR